MKAFARQVSYLSELECYRRLQNQGIRHLGEFDVPRLEGFDDDLMVIEMSIVRPPFLLDFGKVYLDQAPEYWSDPEVVAAWNADKEEIFGPENWMRVRRVIAALRRFGIFYVDPRPSNINLGEDADDRL